eukprot:8837572-Lingulodinium_polyedra.AAC.1
MRTRGAQPGKGQRSPERFQPWPCAPATGVQTEVRFLGAVAVEAVRVGPPHGSRGKKLCCSGRGAF